MVKDHFKLLLYIPFLNVLLRNAWHRINTTCLECPVWLVLVSTSENITLIWIMDLLITHTSSLLHLASSPGNL